MRNIRLLIEYDGADFSGWEIQPGKRTIRGEIERKLSVLLQEEIKLKAGARTDAGVHAICQVANFKTESRLPLFKIRRALLGLPSDIYIKDAFFVPLQFDAHREASSRVYLYRLLLGKSPLLRTRVWECKFELDIKRIERALCLFLGLHRFDLFSYKDSGECEVKRFELRRHKLYPSNLKWHGRGCRKISEESPRLDSPTEVIFEIEANRFLHRMVRMIIGALTELGRGKIKEEHIRLALELKSKKSFCAPGRGLYLKEVKYEL